MSRSNKQLQDKLVERIEIELAQPDLSPLTDPIIEKLNALAEQNDSLKEKVQEILSLRSDVENYFAIIREKLEYLEGIARVKDNHPRSVS